MLLATITAPSFPALLNRFLHIEMDKLHCHIQLSPLHLRKGKETQEYKNDLKQKLG
jgi:hypothetical protein